MSEPRTIHSPAVCGHRYVTLEVCQWFFGALAAVSLMVSLAEGRITGAEELFWAVVPQVALCWLCGRWQAWLHSGHDAAVRRGEHRGRNGERPPQ